MAVDHFVDGERSGFPRCCVVFFCETWDPLFARTFPAPFDINDEATWERYRAFRVSFDLTPESEWAVGYIRCPTCERLDVRVRALQT